MRNNNPNRYNYAREMDKIRKVNERRAAAKKYDKDPHSLNAKEMKSITEIVHGPVETVEESKVILHSKGKRGSFAAVEKDELVKTIEQPRILNFFNEIAQRGMNAKEFSDLSVSNVTQFVVDNIKGQSQESFSTWSDVRKNYKKAKYGYVNDIGEQIAPGSLVAWDLETIGGKDRRGVWNPFGITEFAMKEYDFATKELLNDINIVVGLSEKDYSIVNEIFNAIDRGTIQHDESLKVTASRLAKYGSKDFHTKKSKEGYYIATSFPGGDENDFNNKEAILKGATRLRNIDKEMLEEENLINGLRADHKAVIDAVRHAEEVVAKNGIVYGQNTLSHDNPTLQYVINRWRADSEALSEYIGEKKIWQIDSDRQLDLLGLQTLVLNSRGASELHGGADVSGVSGIRKQENILKVHYEGLKEALGITAHMAGDDTTVLGASMFRNSEAIGNRTFFKHLDEIIQEDYNTKTKMFDIAEQGKKYILKAKNSAGETRDGKSILNFAYDEISNDIFLSNNIVIEGDKARAEGFSAGYGINKDHLYEFMGVQQINSTNTEFDKIMSELAPEFSGGQLFAVKYKVIQDDSLGDRRSHNLTNVMIFRTLKEARAAASSTFEVVAEQIGDEYKIIEGMEDLFDMVEVSSKNGKLHLEGVTPVDASDTDKVKRRIAMGTEKQAVSRAENFLFNYDTHENVENVLKIQKKLSEILDRDATGADIAAIMSKKVSEGQIPLSLEEDVYEKAKKIITSGLAPNRPLTDSRSNNAATGLAMIKDYSEALNVMLDQLNNNASFSKLNRDGKHMVFSRALSAMRSEAALEVYGVEGKESNIAKGISNSSRAVVSRKEIKDIFEIDYSAIDPNKKLTEVTTTSPDALKGIMKINLGGGEAASRRLITNSSNLLFDKKVSKGQKEKKRAIEKMFENIYTTEKKFSKTEAVKKAMDKFDYNKRTGKFANPFNEVEIADAIISGLREMKEWHYTDGIKTHDYSFTKTVAGDIAVNQHMNSKAFIEKIPNIVDDTINNFKMVDIDSSNSRTIAETLVKSYLIPKSFSTTNKTVETLYNQAVSDITDYTSSILSSITELSKSTISIQDNGDIMVDFGAEKVLLDSLPKIKVDDPSNVLYLELGSMKIQLNSIIDYKLTNSGGIRGEGYSTLGLLNKKGNMSKRVKNAYREHGLSEGIKTLKGIMKAGFNDLREQSTINGFGGNDIDSNFAVDVSRIKNIIPALFDNKTLVSQRLLRHNFVDRKLYEAMQEHLKYHTDSSEPLEEMSAEMVRDLVKNMGGILEVVKDSGSFDNFYAYMTQDLGFTLGETKTSSFVMAKNYWSENYTFGAFDNAGRPTGYQAGNSYQIEMGRIKKAKENFNVRAGNIITSPSVDHKVNRTNHIVGDTTSDIMMNIAYVDPDANKIKIQKEFSRILADPNLDVIEKDKAIRIQKSLLTSINVFEQQRAVDSRLYEELMGLQPLRTKKLSVNNGVVDVLEELSPAERDKQFKTVMNKGKFSVEEGTENIIFKKAPGKIIKRGESGLKWRGFGDNLTDFSSYSQYGVMGYNFFNADGIAVSEDVINKVVNLHKDKFFDENKNLKTEAELINEMITAMSAEGYKGHYTIEDVNAAGYKKMFSGSEKGMATIVYATTGYHNENVKQFFKDVNRWDMVQDRVVIEAAIDAAYHENISRGNAALKKAGFESLDALKSAMAEERHTHSELLFDNIYKGMNLLANDNIAGHSNTGQVYQIGVSKAVEAMEKILGSENKAVDAIVDMINNNEDFQFMSNININTLKESTIKLKNENGTIAMLESFRKGKTDAGALNNTKFENLVRHINDKLKEAGYSGSDLLIRENIHVLNKDGEYEHREELFGSFETMEIDAEVIEGGVKTKKRIETILTSQSREVVKLAKDSETESGVHQRFFDLKANKRHLLKSEANNEQGINEMQAEINELVSKKKAISHLATDEAKVQRMNYNEQISELKGKIETSKHARLKLRTAIESTENELGALTGAVKISKMGDTELSILERITVRKSQVEEINSLIASGDVDKSLFLNSIAFKGKVRVDKESGGLKFNRSIIGEQSLSGFLNGIKAEQFYKPLDEDLLTEAMLETEEFQHYRDIFDRVKKYDLDLGVDSARDLYAATQADQAYRFNIKESYFGQDVSIESLMNQANGFEKILLQDLSLDADEIAEKNLIVDLGDRFTSDNRYIAIPGTGMTKADMEIRTDAQRMLRGLSNTQKDFMSLGGNEDDQSFKILHDRMLNKREQIIESIHKATYEKHGIFFNMKSIDIGVATTRMKSSGLVTANSWTGLADSARAAGVEIAEDVGFAKTAIIDGKSIYEWETAENGSRFYNYKVAGRKVFEDAGYYDEDRLRGLGFLNKHTTLDDARLEMDEMLRTQGVFGLGDRYPNNKNESITLSRFFLGSNLAANEIKDSLGVIMENNGDFDGDSSTNFAATIKKDGRTYTAAHYEAVKREAGFIMNAHDLKDLDVAQLAEDRKIMDRETFEEFAKMERAYIMKASTSSGANSNRAAIEKILKDRVKNQHILDGTRVTVPGGKSILGQMAILPTAQIPTFDEFNKLTNDTSLLLEEAFKLSDGDEAFRVNLLPRDVDLDKMTDREMFDQAAMKVSATDLDKALTVIGEHTSDKATMDKYNSIALSKIRVDKSAQEMMAKTGIAATGSVNVAMSAVKLAAYQSEFTLDEVHAMDFIWAALDNAEEKVISSKKATDTYDSRAIHDFKVAMNNVFTGKGVAKETDIQGLLGWWDQYGDSMFSDQFAAMGDLLLSSEELSNIYKIENSDKRLAAGADAMRNKMKSIVTRFTGDDLFASIVHSNKAFSGKHAAVTKWNKHNLGASAALGKSLSSRAQGALGYADHASLEMAIAARQMSEAARVDNSKVFDNLRNSSGAKKTAAEAAQEAVEAASRSSSTAIGGLGIFAIGATIGAVIGGYSSGNPLNEKSATQFSEETPPKQVMSIPDFMEQEGGYAYGNSQRGYVINLKADTKKGRKHIQKIMSRAAESSVGGAVSINMNIKNNKTNYSDRDIYDYIDRNF